MDDISQRFKYTLGEFRKKQTGGLDVVTNAEIALSYHHGLPVVAMGGEINYLCKDQLEKIGEKTELSPIMIVDMAETEVFDSTVVKWLLYWRDRHGGIVLLVAAKNQRSKILQMVGLLPFFATFASLDAAKEVIDKMLEIAQHETKRRKR